ncbi:hypothetical protein [Levilactobacillus angrenensis]|uniref:Uncharacterized protein n=1 Tax=Levilactobacillus angrenensis TaxID=2486020 RepID=A0ABW1UB53_9LACO|nr:hypothetical protein [Levilactobacillus angrenensis]
MANEVEKALWLGFQNSADYRDLAEFPRDAVERTLELYLSGIDDSGKSANFHQWTVQTVLPALADFMEMPDLKNMPGADGFTIFSFNVIKRFLHYLAETGTTKIQTAALVAALDRYEQMLDDQLKEKNLAATRGRDFDETGGPSLPAWQEYTANNIQRYTAKWVAAYLKSPGWRKDRNPGLTRDTLELAVEQLSEQAYDTYRKTPKSWTKKVLSSVLCGYFVSNLDLTAAEIGAVIPVIGHVMTFAAEQGWLNANRAENYQRYLNAIAPKAVAQAQDPNNFGPAKQAIIQMRSEGIEPDDDAAVQAFMDKVNAQRGLDSAYEGGARLPDGTDFTAEEFQALLADDDLMTDLAVNFDTDPQENYLTKPHVTEVSGRRWRQADARMAHGKSIFFGLRLWLLRTRYPLTGDSWQGAFKLMDVLAQLADMLYSQQLVAIDECPAVIWEDFAQWIRQDGYEPQQVLALLTALMRMLVDDGYLSAEAGKRNIATFQPVVKHRQGNVISMKAARKRQRRKKR